MLGSRRVRNGPGVLLNCNDRAGIAALNARNARGFRINMGEFPVVKDRPQGAALKAFAETAQTVCEELARARGG